MGGFLPFFMDFDSLCGVRLGNKFMGEINLYDTGYHLFKNNSLGLKKEKKPFYAKN